MNSVAANLLTFRQHQGYELLTEHAVVLRYFRSLTGFLHVAQHFCSEGSSISSTNEIYKKNNYLFKR